MENPRTIEDILKAAGVARMGEVSDGYHTFDELYEHRVALFMLVCRLLCHHSWRSQLHGDGSCFLGWFVLGLFKTPGSQITYHLPMRLWERAAFAQTLDRAPEFDGHTSSDVLDRLSGLAVIEVQATRTG